MCSVFLFNLGANILIQYASKILSLRVNSSWREEAENHGWSWIAVTAENNDKLLSDNVTNRYNIAPTDTYSIINRGKAW